MFSYHNKHNLPAAEFGQVGNVSLSTLPTATPAQPTLPTNSQPLTVATTLCCGCWLAEQKALGRVRQLRDLAAELGLQVMNTATPQPQPHTGKHATHGTKIHKHIHTARTHGVHTYTHTAWHVHSMFSPPVHLV